ncbi:oxidoreductase, FAD-dependent (plasmid) [Sinorhizobium sojae CCBAU 05684]|uniref:Oxidoreductase, FAD-dependent n=1 Tax=Sinorhizobium sojae CCBAU 05684 TaxID=716928 RepID=A0A249PKI8_9HYPH|nr:FAD-binding protein [Sinorhizobium sojae]ASY66235.1 oxidoreductase, FAD-dependent [Sinorhizobium sojae CCBAU 05684]
MQDVATEALAATMRGPVIGRTDSDYDDVRSLYNGMIDKHPQVIARCADVADVVTAVNFARENGLRVAIRGGGHNGPGLGSVDDGLMIDMAMMKGVRVDPANRTVRAGPGCTQGDVDHATHVYGLAVPAGIVSTTGIAGLALGGGTGYLTRKYGLTIDSLLEADVVLADGSIVTASKFENSDLYWGLRGGGGNFGVVTSFLFQAHPADMVYAGPIFWDLEDAATVMRAYRDFLPTAPEELGAFVGLKTVPPVDPFPAEHQGKYACAIIACYNGPAETGEAVIGELLGKAPASLFNWMSVMPFPALQSMFDPFFPKGLQWYWRGDFVKELTDEAIEVHIAQARKLPSALSLMHLYPIDGAVHRVGRNDTAWNTRNATWSMVIAGVDAHPQKAGEITRWTKGYWEAIHPYSDRGGYVNFMMDDEDDSRLKATYGDNYDRLVSLKGKYDPSNFFCVNQNIRPM